MLYTNEGEAQSMRAETRRKTMLPDPPALPPEREEVQELPATVAVSRPAVIPAEIQRCLQELERATTAYSHITSLITTAQSERAAAEGDYQTAFVSLSENEAAIALDGGAADMALRKTVGKRQEVLLLNDARLKGLGARLQGAREAVDGALRTLSATETAWRDSEVEKAQRAYAEALERFLRDIAHPLAIGVSLNDRSLHHVLQVGEIPGLNRSNAFAAISRWRDNPVMRETERESSAIRQVVIDARAAACELVFGQVRS